MTLARAAVLTRARLVGPNLQSSTRATQRWPPAGSTQPTPISHASALAVLNPPQYPWTAGTRTISSPQSLSVTSLTCCQCRVGVFEIDFVGTQVSESVAEFFAESASFACPVPLCVFGLLVPRNAACGYARCLRRCAACEYGRGTWHCKICACGLPAAAGAGDRNQDWHSACRLAFRVNGSSLDANFLVPGGSGNLQKHGISRWN